MAKNITVIPARSNRSSLAENLQPQKKRIAAVLILGLVALLKSPKDLELEASTSSIRLKAFHPPAHASPR